MCKHLCSNTSGRTEQRESGLHSLNEMLYAVRSKIVKCILSSLFWVFLTRPVITISLCALGEAEKPCILSLVDDTLYEEGEELRLVLGYPKSDSQFGASVGALNETLVKIKDTADSK